MGAITAFTPLAPTARAGTQIAAAAGSFHWSRGPTVLPVAKVAHVKIPEEYAGLDGRQTRELLERLGHKTSGDEAGFVASESQDLSVVIEFHAIGYVSDTEWKDLSPASILAAIHSANRQANAEREQMEKAIVRIGNWETTPAYDPDHHSLEWALRAESTGVSVVNRVVSFLGRHGVVQFIFVDHEETPAGSAAFKQIIRSFAFDPGEQYADSRPGDQTAVGGLSAIFSQSYGSETVEAVSDDRAGTGSRVLLAREYGWLIGIVAAIVGFGVGRCFPRRRRFRRNSEQPHSKNRSIANGSMPPSSAISEPAPGVSHGKGPAETVKGPPASNQIGQAPAAEEGRRKRYDAYSFYERLTRDLHWTINS